MAVDKNLFLYDLAVVAIMKNEDPYVKEWLDYHILAGVNHFYIYDHEPKDNFKEVLQPYIDAGIVTYNFYHDKTTEYLFTQTCVYNEAIKNYKFFCRYMAVIDGDEFIFPKSKPTIPEVIDEILTPDKPRAAALAINWQCFGSNFQEKADYSKGVLERFTRRAPSDWTFIFKSPLDYMGNFHVKSIVNPRLVEYFHNPHFANYFKNHYGINENSNIVAGAFSEPISVEKIAINHYVIKSKEEALKRRKTPYYFEVYDKNEVFDDGILKYRAARRQQTAGNTEIDYQKLCSALAQNLSPVFAKNPSKELLTGKMETFLTCRKLAEYLREKFLSEETANFFEENALKAIYQTLYTTLNVAEAKMLFAELPQILRLDYPIVKDIRKTCIIIAEQIMSMLYMVDSADAKEFVQLQYLIEMLKTFERDS